MSSLFCSQSSNCSHVVLSYGISSLQPTVNCVTHRTALNMKRSAEVSSATATKKVCVPTKPESHAESGISLESLPPHHVSLGGNKLAKVSDFTGTVRVHIRSYVVKKEKLFPSKYGVTMSAKTFKEFMENCYMYDGSNEIAVFNKELMMNCFPSPREIAYRFQQLHVLTDDSFMLNRASVSLTCDQFETLKDACKKLWISVKKLQFGSTFQNAVLQQQGTLTTFSVDIQKLKDVLVEVVRATIKENVEKVFYCRECHLPVLLMPNNQLGHDCMNSTASDRWHRCFDKAFALIEPKVLGIAYANACSVAKVSVPRFILEDLDVCEILKTVQNMECDDDFEV